MKNPKMFYAIKESDKMSTSGGRCRHSFDSIRLDSIRLDSIRKAQRKSSKKLHTRTHKSRRLWRQPRRLSASICAAPSSWAGFMSRRHSLYEYISITELAALNDASASVNMTNFARAKSIKKTSQFDRLADTLQRKAIKARSL